MSGRMRRATIEDRRRQVAALYVRRVNQSDIARQLGVNQATISRDVAALVKQWQKEQAETIEAWRDRDLLELDEMEKDAAIEFSKSKRRDWIDTRLKIKERRAKLMGLDAPTRAEIGIKAIEKMSDDELLAIIEQRPAELPE